MAIPPGANLFLTGQYLTTGTYRVAENEDYFVTMQSDGNLCVYRGSGPQDNRGFVWGSLSRSKPDGDYYTIMQDDGNLCTYKGTGPSDNQGFIWNSGVTASGGHFIAYMRDDGSLCVYKGTPQCPEGYVWGTGASNTLDHSKMVPMGNNFNVELGGTALNGTRSILMDTGSWQVCIPKAWVSGQAEVVRSNVTDCWGQPSDLMKGQLTLTGKDGTVYSIDDFEFYAHDSGGRVLLGGFPSQDSLPYALAAKYSESERVGMGIVSAAQGSIASGWDTLQCYLQLGSPLEVTGDLIWRTDIPSNLFGKNFRPDMVPGFGVTFKFPGGIAPITVTDLRATVDTGAPYLTMRVSPENPQYSDTYKAHFVDERPSWYGDDVVTLGAGNSVDVTFTGSDGRSGTYTFPATTELSSNPPTQAFCAKWDSGVPWPVSTATPSSRINLGNTIYFYCPVYFWDISNRRVGVYFNPSS